MRQLSSFSDQVTDWERLLTTVGANADILSFLEEQIEPFQQVLAEVRILTARQDSHRAGMMVDTRRLQELLILGNDQAREVRSLIRGRLGSRNARLAEFRIPVLGRPRRSPITPTEPPSPPPPQPE